MSTTRCATMPMMASGLTLCCQPPATTHARGSNASQPRLLALIVRRRFASVAACELPPSRIKGTERRKGKYECIQPKRNRVLRSNSRDEIRYRLWPYVANHSIRVDPVSPCHDLSNRGRQK